MESPPLETVYQAISALYDNPNASEKEKASLWLADVQKSIHSWKIADEILQQKKDIKSCYFAAQTMRSKVQHNLSELPAESLISLRDSLIAHLEGTSPDTSGVILTQLSLAIADLALQMTSWQNCISDLIKSFSNKNDYALLEVLTVLPQEIDSTTLKLGDNRREEIKSELRSHSQMVMMFLKESITAVQNTTVALKIIRCMTSWIQVRAVNLQEIPQNAVIGYCLQVLHDFSSLNIIHDAASDCLCALLHCLEENNNNDDIERLLYDSVSALEESYHMAVAHEEELKAANFARIFTELGETFLEKIIACTASGNTHFAMRSLDLALICVGHHDYEVAEITFNLWYRLSEELYQRDYQPLTDMFKPYVERLIEALARHCQCEPDLTQLPEEGDEFFEFRRKVMELIKDVVFIVGSSSVFKQMFATLHSDHSWEQTEAALFVMQAVAKNIIPEEDEYVPRVVEALLAAGGAREAHAGVRAACALLLGELGEWVAAPAHTRYLEPALRALLAALAEPRLATPAATALLNMCKSCRTQARSHARLLLEAARAADTLPLPPPAAAALVRALASALGALPPAQMSVAMREAVAMQLAGLQQVLKSDKPVKKGTVSDPVLYLDRLAALFRDVQPAPGPGPEPAPEPPAGEPGADHPCLPAFCDAWPVIQEVMDKYCGDSRVIERACRAVRFAVRCAGAAGAALAAPLAGALAALYARAPAAHSCVLYVAGVLVDEAGRAAPPPAAPLLALLHALLPPAFALLRAPSGLVDHPDTVDDLFRLCIRALQRLPAAVLASGALEPAVRCAALAARLDHRDANSSVMKFLYDLAKLANTPPPADAPDKQHIQALAAAAVCAYGEEVTCALLEASVLHLHAYMLADVAEALLELTRCARAAGRDWLLAALRRLPRAPAAPAAPTDAQCAHFHHLASRAEKCKEMTKLLQNLARLYR